MSHSSDIEFPSYKGEPSGIPTSDVSEEHAAVSWDLDSNLGAAGYSSHMRQPNERLAHQDWIAAREATREMARQGIMNALTSQPAPLRKLADDTIEFAPMSSLTQAAMASVTTLVGNSETLEAHAAITDGYTAKRDSTLFLRLDGQELVTSMDERDDKAKVLSSRVLDIPFSNFVELISLESLVLTHLVSYAYFLFAVIQTFTKQEPGLGLEVNENILVFWIFNALITYRDRQYLACSATMRSSRQFNTSGPWFSRPREQISDEVWYSCIQLASSSASATKRFMVIVIREFLDAYLNGQVATQSRSSSFPTMVSHETWKATQIRLMVRGMINSPGTTDMMSPPCLHHLGADGEIVEPFGGKLLEEVYYLVWYTHPESLSHKLKTIMSEYPEICSKLGYVPLRDHGSLHAFGSTIATLLFVLGEYAVRGYHEDHSANFKTNYQILTKQIKTWFQSKADPNFATTYGEIISQRLDEEAPFRWTQIQPLPHGVRHLIPGSIWLPTGDWH